MQVILFISIRTERAQRASSTNTSSCASEASAATCICYCTVLKLHRQVCNISCICVFLYSNHVFLYAKVCQTEIAILLGNKCAKFVIAI